MTLHEQIAEQNKQASHWQDSLLLDRHTIQALAALLFSVSLILLSMRFGMESVS